MENNKSPKSAPGITQITVGGYKSLLNEQSIEIRPLTLLAGANSSGKSSMMQPLLLLKQTLESSYDPGPLLLSGPNVKFTSTEQLFSHIGKSKSDMFWVGFKHSQPQENITVFFQKTPGQINIGKMVWDIGLGAKNFYLGMTHEEIAKEIENLGENPWWKQWEKAQKKFIVERDHCFLRVVIKVEVGENLIILPVEIVSTSYIQSQLCKLIHLPGLRGNPERTYPVTEVGQIFPGTFEKYVASVVAQWQANKDERLTRLNQDMERLGLTWKVSAQKINDTQVELRVGRMQQATRGGARDLVNISDVGFGLSQTLPVVVALHAAEPGQLVYLEQPEIHLHPRAQSAMAEILANAAMRGVRVVVETHSALLLLGVQTLVAQGKLPPELVKLHWFRRCKNGASEITSADLDDKGAFGKWPEDFAEVALDSESRYLDAVSSHTPKE